jgi:hypothetical protein
MTADERRDVERALALKQALIEDLEREVRALRQTTKEPR